MSFDYWETKKISEISDLVFSGGTPNTAKSEFWGGENRWLSSGETRERFIESSNKSITKQGIENSSTKLSVKNDILIASAGQGTTRGQVSFNNIDTYINQSLIAIRPNKKLIIPMYLFYNLSNRYSELRQLSDSNAIRGSLTTVIIRNLDIKLPTLKEQKEIIKILYSIDRKISINKRINRNLEDMAKEIYKNWFVDFEPFKNKEFDESYNNGIPRNWKVMKMRDICKIQKGLSYKGRNLKDDGIPMINLGCVEPGGDIRINKLKYYDGEFKEHHTVNSGDIIIANTDMTSDRLILGSPIIVPELSNSTIIFTHHLFAFKDLKISKEYIYYFLKSETFRKRAEGFANGTTVLSLSKEDILGIDFLVPDNKTLENFTKIVGNLIKLKQNNDNENLKLEKIRDLLLPKLMSGEIRVPSEEVQHEEIR